MKCNYLEGWRLPFICMVTSVLMIVASLAIDSMVRFTGVVLLMAVWGFTMYQCGRTNGRTERIKKINKSIDS